MGWFSKTSSNESGQAINWRNLKSQEDLETWNDYSFQQPVMIFKHSTRCSISSMAKNRLERGWNYTDDQVIPLFIDLLAHRDISNDVASFYGITHESPQILIIRNGTCIYSSSHGGIDPSSISGHLD